MPATRNSWIMAPSGMNVKDDSSSDEEDILIGIISLDISIGLSKGGCSVAENDVVGRRW